MSASSPAPTRFTSWAYIGIFVWAVIAVAVTPLAQSPYILALALLAGALVAPRSLQMVKNPRLWLSLSAIALTGAFWLGTPDSATWGVIWSRSGLWVGVLVAMRAFALLVGVGAAAAGMTISRWTRALAGTGLPGLGFALGVAFNLLPTVADLSQSAYHSIRMRGGWRRPLLSGKLYVITITANALRYGEQVLKAAASRAFSPETVRYPPLSVTLADVIVLVCLSLGTGAIAVMAR